MTFAYFEQKFLFVIILVASCVLAVPQTGIPEGNPQITTANFVVVFKPAESGTNFSAAERAKQILASVPDTISSDVIVVDTFDILSFQGMAIKTIGSAIDAHVAVNDQVLFVEPSTVIETADYTNETPPHETHASAIAAKSSFVRRTTQAVAPFLVQTNAPWNLVRICNRTISDFKRKTSFVIRNVNASDIDVYVLDSGIDVAHPDFGGRARVGAVFTADGPVDAIGHGTHVAGIVGSRSFGVCKTAALISVKVLNGSGIGTSLALLAALNWVGKQALAAAPARKAIVNLSLCGSFSQAVNMALAALSSANVLCVSAAGNNGSDACKYSPGSAPASLTVAASDDRDARLIFPASNSGACVGIFAPGYIIRSTYIHSTPAVPSFVYMSGTSMAAPHVAGAAALLWSGTQLTVTQLIAALKQQATRNALTGPLPDRTPNLLLYAGV